MTSETCRGLIAVSIVCLFIPKGVSAQRKHSDIQHDGLAGQVRSVRSEIATFSCKSANCIERSRSLMGTIDYNPDGNMARSYIPGIEPYHSFAYTPGGDRLERQSRTLIPKPPTTSDFGFQSEVYVNVSFYRWTFKYDNSGNRTEEAGYKRTTRAVFGSSSTSIVPVEKISYKYDQSGRKSEASQFNFRGSLIRRLIYEYDDLGSIAVETEIKANNKVANKRYHNYEYDKKGNWVKRTTSMWQNQGSGSSLVPVEVVYRDVSYY